MGRVWSVMSRPIKNYNIENRAHRAMENQTHKPRMAPKYPSTAKAIEQFQEVHPEYLSAQKVEDKNLLEKLKHVRVDSYGPPPEIKAKSTRLLPETRSKHEDFEFGFLEPQILPEGKTSIRLALQFIAEHQAAPQEYTASIIAREHKLDLGQVQQVLRYFQTFHMHLPKEMKVKYPKLAESIEKKKALQPEDYQEMLNLPESSGTKS